MKTCQKCGAAYDMPNHLKYCPECSGVMKKTRWRRAAQKTCAVCGKGFETDTGAACCSPACSRVYARRGIMKKCGRCGQESLIPNGLRLCGDCSGRPAEEESKRLTTDIALYFMVLHAFDLKEAAAELRMTEQTLKKHLQQEDEAHIERLTAYYMAERDRRITRLGAAAGGQKA